MKRGIHKDTCGCFVCQFERKPRKERKITRAVRLSPEEDTALLTAAKDSEVSMSQALQILITDGLKKLGYLPGGRAAK